MFTDSVREAVALKKFSLISPILNDQVDNHKKYLEGICKSPIEMPYYGLKMYAPKTLSNWVSEYTSYGIEALKPGHRNDKGKSRKIDTELALKIKERHTEFPRMKGNLLYETLVGEGLIKPESISLSTFYRFIEDMSINSGNDTEDPPPEMKRFSHECINELWQTDLMYGPYIKVDKKKLQTYLLSYIDDASRLCTYSKFYYAQDFASLRASLKEAVLRRGVPRLLYTDNGKIYRSQQFEYMCASIGCKVLHAKPFMPNQKGKIERFFRTVRSRFLSKIDTNNIKDIDELNEKHFQWLEEDYQRKQHSSIGMSPLDFFMSQVSKVKMVSDVKQLNEAFLLRVSRKINKDATFALEKVLYETEQIYAGKRLEVRYDPEWINSSSISVLLYDEGKKVGEARKVNLHENAHVKRKFGINRKKDKDSEPVVREYENSSEVSESYTTSINYTKMMNDGGI